ncbi:DUF6094 domain-containing protein [Orbus mooreae]|uniref:DUF6094 domain-containing protein n=1 Tax=Orbus mooreae TaxID=3074107 RepID=UPI00370D231D
MALVSPRVAHNLAKNGYYPTDDATIKGIVQCLKRDDKPIRVLDPCVGEGRAASYLAYSISTQASLFGVEFNEARADIAKKRCDRVLRSDLFDTVISPQSFGLLFLNPPYGDLTRENTGAIVNYQKDYKRLEKIFYRFTVPLLQYDGILVFIIPFTQLDEMVSNWLSSQFTDITVFSASDKQFKQIVIMGKKVRQAEITLEQKNHVKALFKTIFDGEFMPKEVGEGICERRYSVPEPNEPEIKAFYKLPFTQGEFEESLNHVLGLWTDKQAFTQSLHKSQRRPLCQMSDWHLSLALAAGEIAGVVNSQTGKTYVIKGDTYKVQTKTTETKSDENGENVEMITTLTDKFIPSIKAWDFTPHSTTFGSLLVISSQVNETKLDDEAHAPDSASTIDDENYHVNHDNHEHQPLDNDDDLVKVGQTVCTRTIKALCDEDFTIACAIYDAFTRYKKGDWGDMDNSDKKLNDRAVKQGQKNDRLFASYRINDDVKLWIMTEWHGIEQGFITTLMLPSEY